MPQVQILSSRPLNFLIFSPQDVCWVRGSKRTGYEMGYEFRASASAECPGADRTTLSSVPIYDATFDSIRASRVKAMDETPIKAGRKERGKMKMPASGHALCWSHSRRDFVEAQTTEP